MDFVSCDWGTTNFRLRWVTGDGGLTGPEVRTDEGAAKLAAAGGDRAALFRETLERGLQRLGAPESLPVVVSGMASSSIGWCELPYARLPFSLDGSGAVTRQINERVLLVSGACSEDDMMRGEETQVLGLASLPGLALPDPTVLVLPGTHSKHLKIRDGAVRSVRTFLTGELFELLARQSVLRHTVDTGALFDRRGFLAGVEAARHQPLTSALFAVRTRAVLAGRPKMENTGFLSGLLIGTELAALTTADLPVIVAAGEALRASYTLAAGALGLEFRWRSVESDPLTALGQRVVLRAVRGPAS